MHTTAPHPLQLLFARHFVVEGCYQFGFKKNFKNRHIMKSVGYRF